MKKITLSLLFIFSFFSTSYSQFGGGGICYPCQTSLEAGVTYPTFDLENASSKPGLHIGIYSYIPFSNEDFSIRFGFSYTNLSAELGGFEENLNFHAFQTPVTFHYRFLEKFQVFAGGEFGINFWGRFPIETGNTVSFEEDDIFAFRERIKFFDASIAFGGGYILWDNLDINIKYNYGLTNVSKVPEAEFKKSWFTLSLAYTFRDY